MHFKYLFLALFCVSPFFTLQSFSQTEAVPNRSFLIKFSPQYLSVNGYVFELEKSLTSPARHSLVFTPHIYKGNTWFIDSFTEREQEDEQNALVNGYGAALMHRIYSKTPYIGPKSRTYISYGFSYHDFTVDFEKLGWKEEPGENGLLYYTYRPRPYQEKISRIGALATAGLQGSVILDRIIGDIYVGVTYKHSNIETNYTSVRYDKNYLDFGFTGLHLVGGLKLGIAF